VEESEFGGVDCERVGRVGLRGEGSRACGQEGFFVVLLDVVGLFVGARVVLRGLD